MAPGELLVLGCPSPETMIVIIKILLFLGPLSVQDPDDHQVQPCLALDQMTSTGRICRMDWASYARIKSHAASAWPGTTGLGLVLPRLDLCHPMLPHAVLIGPCCRVALFSPALLWLAPHHLDWPWAVPIGLVLSQSTLPSLTCPDQSHTIWFPKTPEIWEQDSGN